MTPDELTRWEAERAKRRKARAAARAADQAEVKQEQARRASHIRQALALLGSDGSKRDRREVESAMRIVARQKNWKSSGEYGTWTSPQKKAAKQFSAALRKLEIRLNDPRLTDDVREEFPLDEADFFTWIMRADAAASRPLSRERPEDVAGRIAAEEALKLLTAFGLDAPKTRGGLWYTLSALIFGEPGRDFQQFCSRVKPPRRRTVGRK